MQIVPWRSNISALRIFVLLLIGEEGTMLIDHFLKRELGMRLRCVFVKCGIVVIELRDGGRRAWDVREVWL